MDERQHEIPEESEVALELPRVDDFTGTMGILAIVLGGLLLAQPLLHLSFELPIFAILLLVLGVILLGRALVLNRNEA